MNRIRDWLYIGKYSETKNLEFLQTNNITALLQLATPIWYRDIETKFVAMEDGEPFTHQKLEDALAFIRDEREKGHTVMIACGAGISRSTVIAMAALMEHENRDLFEAYGEVYQRHNAANPHHDLLVSLAEYHGFELDLLDAWEAVREIQRTYR